jgi:hypothetical protein
MTMGYRFNRKAKLYSTSDYIIVSYSNLNRVLEGVFESEGVPVPLSRSTYLVTEVSAGQLNE